MIQVEGVPSPRSLHPSERHPFGIRCFGWGCEAGIVGTAETRWVHGFPRQGHHKVKHRHQLVCTPSPQNGQTNGESSEKLTRGPPGRLPHQPIADQYDFCVTPPRVTPPRGDRHTPSPD